MPKVLTVRLLQHEASNFARAQSKHAEPSLYGVTDGKAVGTYLEHKFQKHLQSRYTYDCGNSAKGIDFPGLGVDIKVTSIKQPQSSCPFKSARQKIYGLGYSLLVFVYDKQDDEKTRTGRLDMRHTIFVQKEQTGDFQTTSGLSRLIRNKANRDDILAFFEERMLPVEEVEAAALADEVLRARPKLGYLTVSNALQWRLQYGRVIEQAGKVGGMPPARMKSKGKIEFGDFQTPLVLARDVVSLLIQRGIKADSILEPTCGVGAFLLAAAEAFPKARLLGWDINPDYIVQTRSALTEAGAAKRATIARQDFFAHDWEAELAGICGSLLILGNLPWVTNAVVSGMNGSNLPAKENFQGFRGIAALTGKSNFDISEWMLIQFVKALRGRKATIAMLCKTGTARKLLRFAWRNDGRIAGASLHRIDTKKHFGAAVDACLLLVGTGEAGLMEADVFDDLSAKRRSTTLGVAGQDLVADIRTYRKLKHLEGLCPYQWRSGVKHDCASVMELRRTDGIAFRNKLGEDVRIEADHLFPLLKCSDLANGRVTPERFVLVTQRRVGEDTATIAKTAPRTWRYLDSHRKLFEARKSSIYSNRAPFALFGIGDYAFAPWKVAVSGLHRTPLFALVGPVDGKPVLFDDTCYFLPFEDENEAQAVAEILNSQICRRFLASLTFTDSKRPFTVELLERLNIHAIAEAAGYGTRWKAFRNQGLSFLERPDSLQAEFVMERPATKGQGIF